MAASCAQEKPASAHELWVGYQMVQKPGAQGDEGEATSSGILPSVKERSLPTSFLEFRTCKERMKEGENLRREEGRFGHKKPRSPGDPFLSSVNTLNIPEPFT